MRRQPSWFGISGAEQLAAVTDEQIEAWRAEAAKLDAEDGRVVAEITAKWKDLRNQVHDFYGRESLCGKKLAKLPIHPEPRSSQLGSKIFDVHRAREWAKRRDADRETIRREEERAGRAILWLTARGLVLGEDFTVHSALGMADRIAFEECVALKEAPEGPGEWVRNDGHGFETPSVYYQEDYEGEDD